MLTTEALIESCDVARKGFASGVDGSGKAIGEVKEEAIGFSDDMLGAVNKEVGPHLKQLVKLVAIGFNKSLLDHRDQFYKVATKSKGARERLIRLRPVDGKLFGGKVGKLNAAMRDKGQVIL